MAQHHLDGLRAALQQPAFYSHAVDSVEIRETHISIVAMAGAFVYKIKKPLDLGFLDFTTLEKRRYYCEQEVALNRRLSRDVYLNVCGISNDDGYRLEGDGPAVEYAVKMRRLPDAAAMDRLLAAGRVTPGQVIALARQLARFYDQAYQDEAVAAVGARETVRTNCEENFTQIEPHAGALVDRRTLDIVRTATRAFLHRRRSLFDRRMEAGFIRDGHGDLRCDHVYFDRDAIQIIDCIEFNDRFRYGDVANDLAFLAMDLDARGFCPMADAFLASYAAATEDSDIYTLIDFYKCYRAMVRLKVNCLRWDQVTADQRPALERQIQCYQRLAYSYALRFTRPVLWVVCGMPATGKSTIATALGRRLDAPVIRTDAVRKELFRSKALASDGASFEAGIYSAHATRLTYGQMLLQAQGYLERRRSVILDATFDQRDRRAEAVRLARDTDAGWIFVECVCAEATVQARLAAREKKPGISDARLHHFEQFKARFEALDEMPPARRLRVDTEQPIANNLRDILAAAEHNGHICACRDDEQQC
ncbi:AAA family ATPase [Desulfatitalea alkaliphila]|uniref:AAA family ATPase n=1 Tax=Desulfatitalea alkaliphila TaxID=2929485 RepID=A0AA41R6B8_9BACT|nr:AAA family ATPase [Desulfatitalea alkaliphila]MCJ8501965.1 AAA family ATPase [Desulfatitalea alkaliphila]